MFVAKTNLVIFFGYFEVGIYYKNQLPDIEAMIEVLAGAAFFSVSSPLNSARAAFSANLLLVRVGVGGSGFGVLGFGAALGFASGLVSGLVSTGFFLALRPGLLPRERLLAGRF